MKEIVQSNYSNINKKQILERMIHKETMMLNIQSEKSYKKEVFVVP